MPKNIVIFSDGTGQEGGVKEITQMFISSFGIPPK